MDNGPDYSHYDLRRRLLGIGCDRRGLRDSEERCRDTILPLHRTGAEGGRVSRGVSVRERESYERSPPLSQSSSRRRKAAERASLVIRPRSSLLT